MSDIGPLDFLYCIKCDRHVDSYLPEMKVDIDKKAMSEEDKMNRVAPVVNVSMRPICLNCRTPLIQKFVSVTVEVKI